MGTADGILRRPPGPVFIEVRGSDEAAARHGVAQTQRSGSANTVSTPPSSVYLARSL